MRVLYIAYHFPPIGGAPVQRNAHFVRHVPELGWEPVVVTGPGTPNYRWTPVDRSLAAHRVEVHRVSAPEPPRSGGWRDRRERWLRAASPWDRWWTEQAVSLALDVAGDAALVHASIAPYGAGEAAVRIARALRLPLVVDFEDPWALDEMLVYPSALHRRLDLRRMRRILRAADAVVMNTSEAARRVWLTFPELREKVVLALPNGFEAGDFDGPVPPRDDDRFRIVHTGSLHTALGLSQRRYRLPRKVLGGAIGGVDFLTRSHVHLLAALEQLCARDPAMRETIEVHLAGVLTDTDRAVAASSPLVRMHGFLGHRETIELARSADLLFLPMHDLPPGRRVAIVPCKTYEYAASGRPMLAAVPDGDARDLLAKLPAATLCRPADVDAITAAIDSAVGRWRRGEPVPPPNADVLSRYEWARLATEVASVWEAVARGVRPAARAAAPAAA